jgi:hypothetical protein
MGREKLRATLEFLRPGAPITVEDAPNSRMIAYVACRLRYGRACFETRPPGAPQHEVSFLMA